MSTDAIEYPWEGQVKDTKDEEPGVPKISLGDFVLGADQVRRITRKSADKMPTKQLRRNLNTAKRPTNRTRYELVKRYGRFVRDTLAEEGMPSPSEGEDEEGKAADNPAVVMTDDSTGNRYMRRAASNGLKDDKGDQWLATKHAELKAWGRPGGVTIGPLSNVTVNRQ